MTNIRDLEQRVADLKAEAAAAREQLAAPGPELEAAEAELGAAQAVYAEARAELGRAQAPYLPVPAGEGVTWRAPSAGDEVRARADLQAAEGAFEQADRQLRAALVRRNELQRRRSDLLGTAARCEQLIAQAERDLERARREAEGDRGMLRRVRDRLAGAGY